MRNRRTTAALAAIALSATLGLMPAETASAVSSAPAAPATVVAAAVVASPSLVMPTAKKYKNCTKLNQEYKHGVGKKGARDKVGGNTKPVRNFKVSTALYKANKSSDRDKDGIACEKR